MEARARGCYFEQSANRDTFAPAPVDRDDELMTAQVEMLSVSGVWAVMV